MLAPSQELLGRLRELLPRAAFVQLEELDALNYLSVVSGGPPIIVSSHNVESQARRLRRGDAPYITRLRSNYNLFRVAATEARAARLADAVLCVSSGDEAYFSDKGARRTILAPNGVDEAVFDLPAAASEPDSVLFFGFLAWPPNRNGLMRFLADGWPRVRGAIPTATLRVVGPGVKEALANVSIPEGVEIVGLVEDINVELTRARAVVVPIWSGGGTRLKVLEAMAAHCSLVSTSFGVDGVGFLNGEHGLLAEQPPSLGDALVRVLSDDALAQRLGGAARAHARRFEWPRALSAVSEMYGDLSSEHRNRSWT